MKEKVYEYLRDVLCPNGGRGNVNYSDICRELGNEFTPLVIMLILDELADELKVDAKIGEESTYVWLR